MQGCPLGGATSAVAPGPAANGRDRDRTEGDPNVKKWTDRGGPASANDGPGCVRLFVTIFKSVSCCFCILTILLLLVLKSKLNIYLSWVLFRRWQAYDVYINQAVKQPFPCPKLDACRWEANTCGTILSCTTSQKMSGKRILDRHNNHLSYSTTTARSIRHYVISTPLHMYKLSGSIRSNVYIYYRMD